MNKRILCLLLSFVMLASVVLTGCSKKEIVDEVLDDAAKNTMKLAAALTITLKVVWHLSSKMKNMKLG